MSTKAVLLDLLMATMDSMSVWARAAGGREVGLAWRDAVTDRMEAAGRYVAYEDLLAEAAAALRLDPNAVTRLRDAWTRMEPWPDLVALDRLTVPFAFVTNCSSELAAIAVERSGRAPAFTVSAEQAGWYKPSPEIYRQAIARIGCDRREVRFVAGAAYDAIGAFEAGVDVRLLTRRPTVAVLPEQIEVVPSLEGALSDL